MTKKSRYFLIVLGFIIFLILAPLIVLYVRGLSYNFKTHTFTQTGILSVITNPTGSDIYLNGKLKRSSSGDVQFLTQGEYQIDVKAPGYMSWSKRLLVAPGQVTWANPADNKIYLFLQNPVQKTLAGGVSDFFRLGNNILYLQNNLVVTSSISNPETAQNYPLPKLVNEIAATNDSGKNFVFENSNSTTSSQSILFFNSDSGLVTDLSSLFKTAPKLQFNGSDLFAQVGTDLYQVTTNPPKLVLVNNNVASFYFQDRSLYLLQAQNSGLELNLSLFPRSGQQLLMANLPNWVNPQLFVTFGKQIFILSDDILYLANSNAESLAQGVDNFNFDSNNTSIAMVQSGELDYYDTTGQNLDFVTRSIKPINNPVIANSIDYAFYSSSGQIQAVELDDRDNQNSYVLYSGQNVQKFMVDDAAKNILVLDNGELKNLTIR